MDLAALRPENTTAAAIAAALQRVEAASAEAQQGVTDAKLRRDGLLLDGSPAQLAASERLLAAARDLAERVAAMEGQLRTRLAAAKRAELLAELAAAKAGYEAASAASAQWWTEAEPELRAKVIQGMRMRRAMSSALAEWGSLQTAASQLYPADAGTADYPVPTESAAPDWAGRLFDALRSTLTREEERALGV
jgi:hypothetical protein